MIISVYMYIYIYTEEGAVSTTKDGLYNGSMLIQMLILIRIPLLLYSLYVYKYE